MPKAKEDTVDLSTPKIYEGKREGDRVIVTVNHSPLNPRLDLWNHGSTGFEWGYGGNGPAQLAVALLADFIGDGNQAIQLHQKFKWEVVSQLPHASWTLTGEQIHEIIQRLL